MEEVSTKITDAILCAIMGEVANRTISFLVGKWRSKQMSPTEEERQASLRRLLSRVRAVVEEAEGRRITSLAMLQQLNALRTEMHRGYYALDRFSCGVPDDEGDKVNEVSRSSALQSNFSSAKRLRVHGGGSGGGGGGSVGESAHQLQRALARMEAALEDVGPEFARLSDGYPRLFRQPYSVYLLMDRCMFGRQMEMEHVVNFLLHADDQARPRLGVLPIVGPGKVGKSTLIHHACADDRVRGHFSRVVFFRASGGDLTAVEREIALAPDDGAADQRVLIIVELDGDVEEGPWTRLCSASESRRVSCGSKMIVTSRSDKIVSIATTLPLKLNFFTPEAYSYFFKVRTFGSTDATEHPKLASIAMEIARELNGCFIAANIFRGILKSSMNARSWSLALGTLREFRKNNLSLFSAPRPVDYWDSSEGPVRVPINSKSTCPGRHGFVILDNYETPSFQSDAEAPVVTVQDVLYGGASLQGKFDVLASRSHLPPHYYYVFNCEVRTTQRVVSKKKKNRKTARS